MEECLVLRWTAQLDTLSLTFGLGFDSPLLRSYFKEANMSASPDKSQKLLPQGKAKPERSFVKRWKHRNLFGNGFLVVPSIFLQNYSQLKPHPLTTGEALFVLHLMEFKWGSEAPFMSYKKLSSRMGVRDKMVRRYAQSLETKKYLRREKRVGRTNQFDLTPLFDVLSKVAEADKKSKVKTARRSNKEFRDAVFAWSGKMVDAYKNLSDEERRELEEWDRTRVDGREGIATSDWPGWEKYIGKRPEFQ